MSRPARYAGNRNNHSMHSSNPSNAPDSAAASALSKAHAQYNEPLGQLKAIFPNWKDDDLISTLEDTRGDVEMAVARISEGHVEQWGSVKHKKDKKLPQLKERDRERDGHGHSTTRGTASPRGRGRGSRGGSHQTSTQRHHREKNANGVAVSSPPPAGWGPEPATTAATTAATANGIAQEAAVDVHQTDSCDTSTPGPLGDPAPKQESHQPTPPSAANKPRKVPASSGMSWAQIAKPQSKPAPPPSTSTPPTHEPSVETQHVSPTPEQLAAAGWEDPATAAAPTFDEEPAPTDPPISTGPPSDDWVHVPTPTADTASDPTAQQSTEQPKTESSQPLADNPATLSTQDSSPTPAAVPVSDPAPASASPPRPEAPETIPPPPGLASPAISQPSAPQKQTSASTSRSGYASRISSKYRSDQAVVLPPSAGFGKSLPLQFGSLDISDDAETSSEPLTQEQQPGATLAPQTVDPQTTGPSASPARSFRAQTQPEAPISSPEAPVSHAQAPSVNPSLAIAPGPGVASQSHPQTTQPPSAHQQPSVASQHTLSGLAHVPQQPGGLAHSHPPSFGQGAFPQQPQQQQQQQQQQQTQQPPQQQQQQQPQSFEGGGIGIGGTPLSHLAQASQAQNQGFFRQTDSPFYNQSQSQATDHGFAGTPGGFGQGAQTGFGTGLSAPAGDFAYEGQRNPYDGYNTQGAFGTRGLRQDDVKGLSGATGAGLGIHHGQNQSNQLGGSQSGNAPNQNQYPGVTHMVNPYYYNANMNPFGYGNQFYSPAFTSFVSPMYQAGGNQTPPHGSKPGNNIPGTGGLGVSGNSNYSSANPGHLHHSSGGFDSDTGHSGTPAYHQASPALASDFAKGVYSGTPTYLGNMGSSAGSNRGPAGSGPVGTAPSSDTGFKGYGGAPGTPSGLLGQDKTGANSVRNGPSMGQAQQQFYPNTRFPAAAQNQGYHQPQNEPIYPYQSRW